MTRHTRPLARWLVTVLLAIAAVAALAWLGPSVIDSSGESAAADAAIAEHREEIKMLRAAIDMCGGENAVAQDMGGGSWQCFTHTGAKTITARIEK